LTLGRDFECNRLITSIILESSSRSAYSIIEVHHHEPDKALLDGMQSLYPDQFDELMAQVRQIAPILRRTVPGIGEHVGVGAERAQ